MGESGSVAYRFRPVGIVRVAKSSTDEDTLLGVVLDAGAEDVRTDDEEVFEVVSQPEDFAKVREAVESAGIKVLEAEYTMEPTDTVHLDVKDAAQMLRMMERLEDDDDVQNVHANFEMTDEVMEAASH